MIYQPVIYYTITYANCDMLYYHYYEVIGLLSLYLFLVVVLFRITNVMHSYSDRMTVIIVMLIMSVIMISMIITTIMCITTTIITTTITTSITITYCHYSGDRVPRQKLLPRMAVSIDMT